MNNNDQNRISRAIVDARDASCGDGWPIFVEALLVALALFHWKDNALLALVGFVATFILLAAKPIGTLVSIGLGGAAGWCAGHGIFLKYARWDFGVVVGLVVMFCVFTIHQYHVKAFDRN